MPDEVEYQIEIYPEDYTGLLMLGKNPILLTEVNGKGEVRAKIYNVPKESLKEFMAAMLDIVSDLKQDIEDAADN